MANKGVYACAGCDTVLFSSETKCEDESQTGLLSFWGPILIEMIVIESDNVKCANCNSRLGYISYISADERYPTGILYSLDEEMFEFEAARRDGACQLGCLI